MMNDDFSECNPAEQLRSWSEHVMYGPHGANSAAADALAAAEALASQLRSSSRHSEEFAAHEHALSFRKTLIDDLQRSTGITCTTLQAHIDQLAATRCRAAMAANSSAAVVITALGYLLLPREMVVLIPTQSVSHFMRQAAHEAGVQISADAQDDTVVLALRECVATLTRQCHGIRCTRGRSVRIVVIVAI